MHTTGTAGGYDSDENRHFWLALTPFLVPAKSEFSGIHKFYGSLDGTGGLYLQYLRSSWPVQIHYIMVITAAGDAKETAHIVHAIKMIYDDVLRGAIV